MIGREIAGRALHFVVAVAVAVGPNDVEGRAVAVVLSSHWSRREDLGHYCWDLVLNGPCPECLSRVCEAWEVLVCDCSIVNNQNFSCWSSS